jgi:streptomycin 3"-adenylyltransferase
MPSQYVTALADALLAEPLAGVVGVYLHGSAVLGGYTPRGSDIDVIAVIAEPADVSVQERMRDRLIAAAKQWPEIALEMSVITAATAAVLGDCPFEVHVAVNGDEVRSALGAGQGGDPDLILYAEVCRRHGLAVYGPPASEVFAPVPEQRLIRAVHDEVRWGREHGHLSYAVLNACRALRFATVGVLCSKLDGGEWMLARRREEPVIRQALADQRAGVGRPMTAEANRFVGQVLDELSRRLEPRVDRDADAVSPGGP